MPDETRFADLVFEGGGVKGIGLAGAFSALQQRGFVPKSVAGTSAGAITAALVAAGYSARDLDAILLRLPFKEFKDQTWQDRIPLVGRGAGLLLELGIYEGRYFQDWIADLLKQKGITRFGQVVDDDAEDPDNRYRLRVIASDVTHRRMLVLPNDAEHLGIDPDEMEIAYAVRMSMSIPIFFEPVVHENPRTGDRHLIVDGGMLSNFPVWLFDCHGRDPKWPTFGLKLVEPDPKVPIGHRIAKDAHETDRGSLVDFVKSLALTMMAAHDRLYLEQATYARTIAIPTLGVGTTEFEIERPRIEALYESGRKAASDFLGRWDFQAYIEEYRRGREHHRRDSAMVAT
jgi:NTE family protein